mmetsp:Transcript_172713/g.553593  ORF Transcript_172713/g.553593 Transcript_172713/m.553593 type:complete len:267 (+) Transcript_172713:5994-6794(+)
MQRVLRHIVLAIQRVVQQRIFRAIGWWHPLHEGAPRVVRSRDRGAHLRGLGGRSVRRAWGAAEVGGDGCQAYSTAGWRTQRLRLGPLRDRVEPRVVWRARWRRKCSHGSQVIGAQISSLDLGRKQLVHVHIPSVRKRGMPASTRRQQRQVRAVEIPGLRPSALCRKQVSPDERRRGPAVHIQRRGRPGRRDVDVHAAGSGAQDPVQCGGSPRRRAVLRAMLLQCRGGRPAADRRCRAPPARAAAPEVVRRRRPRGAHHRARRAEVP